MVLRYLRFTKIVKNHIFVFLDYHFNEFLLHRPHLCYLYRQIASNISLPDSISGLSKYVSAFEHSWRPLIYSSGSAGGRWDDS